MTTPIASGRKRTIEEMTKLFKNGQFETSHIFILRIQNYIYYLKQFSMNLKIVSKMIHTPTAPDLSI